MMLLYEVQDTFCPSEEAFSNDVLPVKEALKYLGYFREYWMPPDTFDPLRKLEKFMVSVSLMYFLKG